MMMRNIKKNKRVFFPGLTGILLAMLIVSCNKDFDRVLENKDYLDTATVAYGNPKVLYIIADGARGVSVRDANTPNIHSLLPTSIYSWNSLSDPDSTNTVTNWADMLTGVRKEKHEVLDKTFTGNRLDRFPVVFQRVKENKPNMKIACFTSSDLFKEHLTAGADVSELEQNDAGVKDAAVNNLKTDTASVVVAHFTGIEEAGKESGFDNSFPGYKAAIEQFDGYVGEILTALKSRPTYGSESWLVIVASSTGGQFDLPPSQNDNTIFSNTAANTFIIYHNPTYNLRIIAKPYTGNRFLGSSVRLFGKDNAVRAQIPSDDIYNFADSAEFTIELKIKKNPGSNNNYIQNYPSVLGKLKEWSSSKPADAKGWVIFLENTFWQISVRGTKGNLGQTRGGDLGKGIWNAVAVKCERREGKRFLRTYTDGVYYGEMDVTDYGGFENDQPLTLGYITGTGHGEPDVEVADVRIWRKALPDETIKEFACETYIDENHPYYSYLAGYWPCTDGSGGRLKDLSYQENDFVLQGQYTWQNFNDLICAPSAAELASMVPQNADIPAQIFSWLRIPRNEQWQLDGRVWLDQQ